MLSDWKIECVCRICDVNLLKIQMSLVLFVKSLSSTGANRPGNDLVEFRFRYWKFWPGKMGCFYYGGLMEVGWTCDNKHSLGKIYYSCIYWSVTPPSWILFGNIENCASDVMFWWRLSRLVWVFYYHSCHLENLT